MSQWTFNEENRDPEEEHSYACKRHFDHTYCRQNILTESSTSVANILRNLPSTSQTFEVQEPSASSLEIVEENIVTETSKTVPDPEPSTSSLEIVETKIVPGTLKTVRDLASKRQASKKRLFRSVENLSPTSRLIYAEYLKAKQQLNFSRRAKRALKFCKDESFQKLTKDFNPFAKKLFQMQVKLSSKKKKARRFSTEEKLIALSIMKQSPKCYRFLHKIFILPSRSTLNKMIAKFKINAGVNSQLFNLLQKEVSSWNDKKKPCSVIFDEMALETALSYDKNNDLINGFVELTEKKPEFADHALVFLLRGAVYKWQQPVAFYLCQGSTAGIELKKNITTIIALVKGCGLKPIALICDQGTAFQSALHSLRQETEREQILSNQVPDGTVTIDGVNMNIIQGDWYQTRHSKLAYRGGHLLIIGPYFP